MLDIMQQSLAHNRNTGQSQSCPVQTLGIERIHIHTLQQNERKIKNKKNEIDNSALSASTLLSACARHVHVMYVNTFAAFSIPR